jgi:hypothetical protein
MPAAMKGFLENQFQLKTEDGSVIGALTSNGTNVWGLNHFSEGVAEKPEIIFPSF